MEATNVGGIHVCNVLRCACCKGFAPGPLLNVFCLSLRGSCCNSRTLRREVPVVMLGFSREPLAARKEKT